MVDTRRPLVFMSYRMSGASTAARGLARRLRERLATADVLDEESVVVGSNWHEALRIALNRARVLLVLIDDRWLQYQDEYGRRRIDADDDFVRREIETGLSRGIPVLPVLLDDASMPPPAALPHTIRSLTARQAVRLAGTDADRAAAIERLAVAIEHALANPAAITAPHAPASIRLLELHMSGFRCFDQLHVSFDHTSELGGDWTCIAGVNGAGKSTILQAVSLLMLGPDAARELGGVRLRRLRRRSADGFDQDALLRARLLWNGEEQSVELSISARGPEGPWSPLWDPQAGGNPTFPSAGYGASRNLSERPDQHEQLSAAVRAHISLFDPMARLERAEAFLRDPETPTVALEAFREVVASVFETEVDVANAGRGEPTFRHRGVEISAHELPDGFRSSIAWLADLCSITTHQIHETGSSRELHGVVLVDELDLHLHASLQRIIVPRLRSALPNVQFIVTSHSPLILSSFDTSEIIAIDRDASGGVRTLDRQLLGFSANEIYEWLFRTPPSSAALESRLEAASRDPRAGARHLAELLLENPETSADTAKQRIARIRDRLDKRKS